MNRIILQLLAVSFCFAAVQTLQCYKCSIGFGDLCLTTKTTCKEGELCYNGIGIAAGLMDIKMKGCLAPAECNKTSTTTIPGTNKTTVYSMTKTCCSTDLCNSAPAGLPGALQLALVSVAAVFAANALV